LQSCMFAVAIALTAGCSTTYDTGATTTTTVSTTTTLPKGTTEELLANILSAVTGLGDAIVNDSAEAKERLADINANWKVVQEDFGILTTDDVDPLARLVALANTAVTRKRPADADKAQKFLPAVIEALLEKL
jgi:hypothetical protein